MKVYYVYILAGKTNAKLYVGKTGNLLNKVLKHKSGKASKFASKYGLNKLVFYEKVKNVDEAILREKQLKKLKMKWKLRLIEDMNPTWKDLSGELLSNR
jgi:putative endonuclease